MPTTFASAEFTQDADLDGSYDFGLHHARPDGTASVDKLCTGRPLLREPQTNPDNIHCDWLVLRIFPGAVCGQIPLYSGKAPRLSAISKAARLHSQLSHEDQIS
ncbi:hypothetical protein PG993_004394 [Apiospora rasikravindrae]|uniref:Uncharacterized protein n=1 Tax=Apiospora rasikravindrae TaxID=990691 RepID=A0ABR1TCL6_9PEZI